MGRQNHIKLSDEEYELLEEYRLEAFGTPSVPFGEAVEHAIEEARDE